MRFLKGFIIALLVIALIGGIGLSYFIGNQVFEGSTRLVSNEDTSGELEDYSDFIGVNPEAIKSNFTIEKLEIPSSMGEHNVPGDYIYAPGMEGNKDNKTIILVHGLGGNRYTNYPVALFFLNEGYNIITYDQRNSNENLADRSTFGYLEKYDLIDFIKFVEENSNDVELGIWGSSFGGATTGLALGYEDYGDRVDYAILDCPVSSMEWMIKEQMKYIDAGGIPFEYLTFTGNIVNRIKLGFSYEDADVPTAISKANTPIFVINSKIDEVTPEFMGADIYKASNNPKSTIWTVEDSVHANIWVDYPEEYMNRVNEFIRSVMN